MSVTEAPSSHLILGAQGHGREVLDLLLAVAKGGTPKVSFLDDDASLQGRSMGGILVVGGIVPQAVAGAKVYMGVGYPEVKRRIHARLNSTACEWPALVHPSCIISQDACVGLGGTVQAGGLISTNVRIDKLVTINLGVTLSHDVVVSPFATVSPGACLGGNVHVGEGAFIGIGASVVQGIRIGEWSVIGAGAVVIENVEPNTVVAGVPARVIKRRERGWQNG